MRKILSLLGALALVSTTAVADIEIPLKRVTRSTMTRTPGAPRVFIPLGINRPDKLLKCPPGKWQLPPIVSKQPIFFLTKIGTGKLLMLLDRQSAKSPSYDRLYLDANGNGDLTDEAPIDMTKQPARPAGAKSPGFSNRFAINTPITVNGRSVRISFNAMAYYRPSSAAGLMRLTKPASRVVPARTLKPATKSAPARPKAKATPAQTVANKLNFYLMADSALAGQVTLDGLVYQVLMGDNDGNGIFGEPQNDGDRFPNARARTDLFFIGTKKDFVFSDGIKMGSFFSLGNQLYAVDLKEMPAKLNLRKVTIPTRTVTMPSGLFDNLTLRRFPAGDLVMCQPQGGKIVLPLGQYQVFNYSITKADDGGNRWQAGAVGTVASKILTIDSTTTGLTMGEPFKAATIVYPRSRKNTGPTDVQLRLEITGAAGETISTFRCLANPRTNPMKKSSIPMSTKKATMPIEAAYKVFKKDGEIALEGNFKYG